MTATIYNDFVLYKWLHDIELWYTVHHYPPKFEGPKTLMDQHLRIMKNYYDYDQIEGDNVREKRINYFNFCQQQVEIEMARMP